MSRCADPYNCGCDGEDIVVEILVDGFTEDRSWENFGEMVGFPVTIGLCPLCAYWENDHDWDKKPKGPSYYVEPVCWLVPESER